MKLITEFENYVTSVYNLSELDRTISEDGRIVSYALTCRSNEHQFINLKQVDDDYIRFEMYFENIRVQSDYFVDDKQPETQMRALKALFDYTFDAYISTLGYVNLTENGISVFYQKFIDIQSITTYSKRRIELEFSEVNKK